MQAVFGKKYAESVAKKFLLSFFNEIRLNRLILAEVLGAIIVKHRCFKSAFSLLNNVLALIERCGRKQYVVLRF
jgi:hypothetical protein